MSSPLVVQCILAVLFGGGHTSTIPHANFDVIVYGGTPSGIMAAISAARTAVHTPKVLLLEPSPYRVGGMTAGGLGHTDLGVGGREIGGFVAEFYARVSSYYTSAEPTADQQCYNVESHVAEQVYTAMLNSSGVVVQLGEMLSQVKKENARIVAISMISGKTFEGSVFIDATYEGDLMALAGVSYTVGREASSQYSEESGGRLAPNDVLARYQFQVRRSCSVHYSYSYERTVQYIACLRSRFLNHLRFSKLARRLLGPQQYVRTYLSILLGCSSRRQNCHADARVING